MRMLLIHSTPIGFIHSDKASAMLGFSKFRPAPSNSPRTRLARMVVERDGNLIGFDPIAMV